MSYSRCGENSDVYVIKTMQDMYEITACACDLVFDNEHFKCSSAKETINVLVKLEVVGYRIPTNCFIRLFEDLANEV